MPTTRPRHTLTETDELAAALEAAAVRWPEDAASRTALLLRLIQAGQQTIAADREQERERRRAAVEHTAGTLTGVYGAGYLERLRGEWPE